MSEPRIQLEHVGKRFGATAGSHAPNDALADISLTLQPGEFVCLLGPSGCGKSTILNLIAGFDKPTTGAVLLDGKPVARPGPERGFVFQQPTLFPWLNVLDNVTFGPRMAGIAASTYCPRQSVISRSSVWRDSSVMRPGNCPAACGNGWHSRARGCPIRRSC